jgi:hypothetical protein
MHLLSKVFAAIFVTAYDPGTGQAESPTSEVDSGE